MNRYVVFAIALVALATGLGLGLAVAPAQGQQAPMLYELRSYWVHEGKAEDIHKRFREHTMALFEKHGMKNIGYWVPAEPKPEDPALIYIVAHTSREQANASWKAFSTDPEWQAVQKASEANGKIVSKVVQQYLTPTDYSQLK